MNSEREIIKANWLQQKVRRKGGTLLKKKKVMYEEAEWVVLCVHSNRIPLLEWYFSEKYQDKHEPLKLIDLLNSAFVSPVIGDNRSFIIGFARDSARETIELAALTPEDCSEWVRLSTITLVRLQCLKQSSNLYTSLPDSSFSRNTSMDDQDEDEVPECIAPSPPIRTSGYYEHFHMTTSPVHSLPPTTAAPTLPLTSQDCRPKKVSNTAPPPLPPRTKHSLQYQHIEIGVDMNGCIYDHLKIRGDNDSAFNALDSEETVGSVPTQECSFTNRSSTCDRAPSLSTVIEAPSIEIRPAAVKHGYSIPSDELNVSLPMPSCSYVDSNLSYDTLQSPPNRAIVENDYDKAFSKQDRYDKLPDIRRSKSVRNDEARRVESFMLQLSLCMKHIHFAEINNRIWITGWANVVNKNLCGLLHVGDALVQVDDIYVSTMLHLTSLLTAKANLSQKVRLTVEHTPYGATYYLNKVHPDFDSGIRFHKHENRISDVCEGSAAWKAGIKAVIPAVTHSGSSPSFVTSINGEDLSLFSKYDEVKKKLDSLTDSGCLFLVIQPYDFIKLLKKSLNKDGSLKK